MKPVLLLILIFSMFTSSAPEVCSAESGSALTFGILPYFSAAKLMELHKPLRAINHHVALKALKEHGLEAGKTVTIIFGGK